MKRSRSDYYLDESKRERKRRKKREKIRMRILTILLAVIVLLLGFILLFHAQKITVTGNEYCTQEEILKGLKKDPFSSNTFYLWLKYNYTDAELLPQVEDCEVHMKNPWTIELQVYEKTIIGYLEINNQFIYFDKDGTVLQMSNQATIEGIPRIEGIEVTLSDVKEYEQLPVKDKDIFSTVLEVTTEVQNCSQWPDRIVFENDEVKLYFGNIRVLLGTGNMTEKIAQIQPILEKLQESYPDTAGTLHLENYSSTYRIINFQPGETDDTEQSADAATDQTTDQTTDDSTDQDVDDVDDQSMEEDVDQSSYDEEDQYDYDSDEQYQYEQ